MKPEKKDLTNGNWLTRDRDNGKAGQTDRNKWIASLEHILEYISKNEQPEQASLLLEELSERLRESGLKIPLSVNTPYINTIPPEKEPLYPGNREIERRIKSYIRWNAMAMVVKANRLHPDIGGHISTYASAATLYEVGFNHFFRGGDSDNHADMVFFQGHASPAIYSSALLEWGFNARKVHYFRQELSRATGRYCNPLPLLCPAYGHFTHVSWGIRTVS